jgi:methylthioribulose-1-phosphate dehydratase
MRTGVGALVALFSRHDMTHSALARALPPQATGAPETAIAAILRAGVRMHRCGWVPATAGNISVRLGPDRLAITRSGTHKGYLEPPDIIEVDLDGRPLLPVKPSAETGLHCQIYRLRPEVGAVLHGHSVAATVLSMHSGDAIRFAGYEIVKAFEGQTTHATQVDLPIFDNDQDIGRLAVAVEPLIRSGLPLGYLIRGHGVYIWADKIETALARLEGLEFLLACELERRKLAR